MPPRVGVRHGVGDLVGEESFVRSKKRVVAMLAVGLLALAGCGNDDGGGSSSGASSGGGGGGPTKLGFAQVCAESGWRTANTKSIQESAKEAGIDLKFFDAQQKQENQIKAI